MPPGERLIELVAIMDRLRSPGGCPWDAQQTHESLLSYLLEETHELVEAVESDDRESLKEELGDVLLQVVFHARIASEDEVQPFDIDAVADGIINKLVKRHPHVFGGEIVTSAEEVAQNWELSKAAEKGRTSAVDGVPMGQPALLLAGKLIHRASRHGIEIEIPEEIFLDEEITAEGVGEVLLRVVALAAKNGIDAEAALRGAARNYAAQVKAAEQLSFEQTVE
ncbi:nucleoside triphosphate pyrophosphohydrolase [mine drainage metagenome]|uniref:Nucleoside triphosphate pyrophosphohydrolase n=1 Tax=mine drainage metagenome TaxID=410659 RepID=A0A1J5P110_9ZZZZ